MQHPVPSEPSWVQEIVQAADGGAQEDLVDAAVQIACASAERQHGPFGALIVDADHHVLSAGFNRVVAARDSTAHAEVEAIRRAQARLDTHDLGAEEHAPLALVCSCEPCIMCFGVVYWSGLARFVAAAPARSAEAIGFQEGPVTDEMWRTAGEDKGIQLECDVTGQQDPEQPFRIYEDEGGIIY